MHRTLPLPNLQKEETKKNDGTANWKLKVYFLDKIKTKSSWKHALNALTNYDDLLHRIEHPNLCLSHQNTDANAFSHFPA